MAARTKSRVTPKYKTKYRVKNWPADEASLRIHLMALDLMTPDHTTLSRRSSTLEVAPLAKTRGGSMHLVIDSTGLKVVGDGECR